MDSLHLRRVNGDFEIPDGTRLAHLCEMFIPRHVKFPESLTLLNMYGSTLEGGVELPSVYMLDLRAVTFLGEAVLPEGISILDLSEMTVPDWLRVPTSVERLYMEKSRNLPRLSSGGNLEMVDISGAELDKRYRIPSSVRRIKIGQVLEISR